jgi:hypothetical protein
MVVQAKKRLKPYFLGHGVDRFVFFSAPIPLNVVVLINFYAICNGEYQKKTGIKQLQSVSHEVKAKEPDFKPSCYYSLKARENK